MNAGLAFFIGVVLTIIYFKKGIKGIFIFIFPILLIVTFYIYNILKTVWNNPTNPNTSQGEDVQKDL